MGSADPLPSQIRWTEQGRCGGAVGLEKGKCSIREMMGFGPPTALGGKGIYLGLGGNVMETRYE